MFNEEILLIIQDRIVYKDSFALRTVKCFEIMPGNSLTRQLTMRMILESNGTFRFQMNEGKITKTFCGGTSEAVEE